MTEKRLGRVSLLVLAMFLFSFVLAGCGGKTDEGKKAGEPAEKLKVGWVYIGSASDAGWTMAHDQGRKYLQEKLGDKVDTNFIVENVPEGADSERVITELAEKGCKVIFATSFGYMDSMAAVAKKYPDVVFEHCSGYKTDKNLGTYFGRMYQARYLTGLVAGKMTKTNKIGYVAAMPIPEVIRGINAFTMGVRAVNPNATVSVVWTNSWFNPASEKEAAKSLLDKGCDVITQHQDSPAAVQAAEEKGVYSIGYDSDMSQYAPKGYLTGAVWNWGPYYVKVVEAVLNGTWKSEQYWGPMSEGIVGLTPLTSVVPQDVKDLVAQKEADLKAGKFDVFNGPVKDQQGNLKVPAGQDLSDQDKLSFDWFVEGVEGSIPKQ